MKQENKGLIHFVVLFPFPFLFSFSPWEADILWTKFPVSQDEATMKNTRQGSQPRGKHSQLDHSTKRESKTLRHWWRSSEWWRMWRLLSDQFLFLRAMWYLVVNRTRKKVLALKREGQYEITLRRYNGQESCSQFYQIRWPTLLPFLLSPCLPACNLLKMEPTKVSAQIKHLQKHIHVL